MNGERKSPQNVRACRHMAFYLIQVGVIDIFQIESVSLSLNRVSFVNLKRKILKKENE